VLKERSALAASERTDTRRISRHGNPELFRRACSHKAESASVHMQVFDERACVSTARSQSVPLWFVELFTKGIRREGMPLRREQVADVWKRPSMSETDHCDRVSRQPPSSRTISRSSGGPTAVVSDTCAASRPRDANRMYRLSCRGLPSGPWCEDDTAAFHSKAVRRTNVNRHRLTVVSYARSRPVLTLFIYSGSRRRPVTVSSRQLFRLL